MCLLLLIVGDNVCIFIWLKLTVKRVYGARCGLMILLSGLDRLFFFYSSVESSAQLGQFVLKSQCKCKIKEHEGCVRIQTVDL